MSELRTVHSPIVIDRVERSRGDGDSVRLRLGGRRLVVASESELDPLLVVQLRGHRYRFAASKSREEDPSPGSWRASFTVPDWAVPLEYGSASLWIGEASVPVPPVGTRNRTPVSAVTSAVTSAVASALTPEPAASKAAPAAAEAEVASRTDLEATHAELRAELAQLVEAVAAQQAEFERRLDEARQRSEAELAQTRGEVDHARAARSQAGAEAERARLELAAVSERLAVAAASDQMRVQEAASLREQLAITAISRDAAVAEAAGLRAELSRLGSELAVRREQADAGDGELGVAQQLLEDARALTSQLRGQSQL
jgi:hypothetical protein